MLAIPDDVLRAAPVSERELCEDIAVLLYQKGVPLGKAASLIPMDRLAFRHLLASRQVPVSYGRADLDDDLRTLAEVLREQPFSDQT